MSREWLEIIGSLIDEEELDDFTGFTPVASSNLAAVKYDKNRYELIIIFNDASVYRYEAVPPEEYRGLMRADSHGEYFVDNIRLIYPFERIAG